MQIKQQNVKGQSNPKKNKKMKTIQSKDEIQTTLLVEHQTVNLTNKTQEFTTGANHSKLQKALTEATVWMCLWKYNVLIKSTILNCELILQLTLVALLKSFVSKSPVSPKKREETVNLVKLSDSNM